MDEVTATAEKRIAELREQRKKLDVEMEFYKKDPNKAPMPCVARSVRTKTALPSCSASSPARNRKSAVHQKFDTELAKLKVLWEIHKPVVLPAASGRAIWRGFHRSLIAHSPVKKPLWDETRGAFFNGAARRGSVRPSPMPGTQADSLARSKSLTC